MCYATRVLSANYPVGNIVAGRVLPDTLEMAYFVQVRFTL